MIESPASRRRRAVQRIALSLAALSGLWMLVLLALGGFDGNILGIPVTTHEPMRPLFVAALFGAIYMLAGGAVWLPEPGQVSTMRRWTVRLAAVIAILCGAWTIVALVGRDVRLDWLDLHLTTNEPWQLAWPGILAAATVFVLNGVGRTSDRIVAALGRADPRVGAGVLALAVTVVGFNWMACAAGGSDSYGYLSEVPLWLRGDPVVQAPWATQVPWPNGIETFTPLAYRPKGPDTLVPTYPAGLPFLMGAAQLVGGPCAVFWITPISGGVFVYFTWLLGRRLGSSRAGSMAAVLAATCPPMLLMFIAPMTDVPVAAAWTVAWCLLLGPGLGSAIGAGAVAGMASLIRPNLAPLAAVFMLWKFWRIWGGAREDRARHIWQFLGVGAGLLPFAVTLAAINQHLYGSPLLTGYGPASGYYARDHIVPNVSRYISWLIETETPLIMLGIAAFLMPLKRVWTNVPHRSAVAAVALFVVALWAQYQAFMVFDAWWYVRFMLPIIPPLLVATMRVLELAIRPGRAITAVLVYAVVLVLGVRGLRSAVENGSFDTWRGDRKYVTVGQLVGRVTPPNSVVLSMQQSGSVRYYGGRVTLRYDAMQSTRIDQDLAWLAGHGAHPYALVEDWEADIMRQRFAGSLTAQRLNRPPLFRYDGPSNSLIYDLMPPPGDPPPTQVIVEDFKGPRCVPPAPLPTLVFK